MDSKKTVSITVPEEFGGGSASVEIHESFSIPGNAIAKPYGEETVTPGGAPLRVEVWFAEDSEGLSCCAAVLENVFGSWTCSGWVADACPLEDVISRYSGKPGSVGCRAVVE